MADKILGPFVDRIESTPDMAWPSPEGRLNAIEDTYFATVTFDVDGGSSVPVQKVPEGGKATKPANPTKTGYTFDDWYDSAAKTTKFNFSTQISEDTTIYAKWTINTYTVTFDSNEGSAVASQTVDYNAKATEPTDPTKSHYTFEGWFTDEELTTEYDFDTPVTADITLYAKWAIVQLTVTFNVDGGSEVPAQTVDYGSTATEPDDPTKEGKTFGGWYTTDALLTEFDFTDPITVDTTIYAKWTEV